MHCLRPTRIVSCLVLWGVMNNLDVAAQGTTAICKPGFSWMSNSLGQSPCLMAAYLGSVCSTDPSTYIVGPTAFGYHLPTTSAHDCTCNTVAYSMFSACALCQTQVPEYGSWSSWITNCTDSFVSQYPRPLPTGTAIPAWAFFDVTGTSEFNATVAQAIAIQDPSEISATGTLSPNSPSNTSPPISPSSLPLFASQTFSSTQESPTTVVTDPNSHSSHSGSKKHVGAIVGGVVGGVAFLASLAGAALLLERRQRSSHRPRPASTAVLDASSQSHPDVLPTTPSVNEKGSLLSPSSVSGVTPNTLPSNARLYDPNDPSTFPDQVVTPTQSAQRGGYAGYPEL